MVQNSTCKIHDKHLPEELVFGSLAFSYVTKVHTSTSLITYSVHSLSAVSNLLMVFEVISRTCWALGDVSSISEIAATALATTCKTKMLNKGVSLNNSQQIFSNSTVKVVVNQSFQQIYADAYLIFFLHYFGYF